MRTELKVIALLLGLGVAVYAGGAVAAAAVFGVDVPGVGPLGDDGTVDATPDEGPSGSLVFADVADEAGIEYRSTEQPYLDASQEMMSSSGAYVTDYNDDGRPDVLLIGGERPVLYENRGGTFVETDAVPDEARGARTALFFDATGDGTDELLLLGMGAPPVLLENRDGTYERVDAGLDVRLDVPIGAAAADYTGNGCLDLFVIQNGDWSTDRPEGLRNYDVTTETDNGNPNYLFAGDCSSFERVDDAGITGEHWSLATSFVDFTGDGRPDIHVANDFYNDELYVNRGDGTFERVVLDDMTNRNGMSSAVADVDGDGRLDLFVTNIWFPELVWQRMEEYTMDFRAHGNNLLLNRGDGEFEHAAEEYGVDVGGWGWAAVLADLDNDGDLDAFHATRHYRFEYTDQRFSDEEIRRIHAEHEVFSYPAVWEGRGDRFEPLSAPATGFEVTDGRGVAEFDANGDGRLDLLVADNDGHFRLYENRADGGDAVVFDLERDEDTPANGARLEVVADGETSHHVVDSNSDYLAQGDRRVHVGVGDAESVSVRVTWPDGTVTAHDDLAVGRTYVLDPSGGIDERSP